MCACRIGPRKRFARFIAGTTLPGFPTDAYAASVPTWETPPGWTETRGGAGGKVIRVTSLATAGDGSLAAALTTEGPRVIEFAVAGIIDLGGQSASLTQPFANEN